jgi:hypothetical protein
VTTYREPGWDDEAPHPGGALNGASAPASPPDPWCYVPRQWLDEPPPPRRWLLKRPTRDGEPCPGIYGDGLLPMGRVGLLVADGGVGKTMTLVALAVSIITGRAWLDYYYVPPEARSGKVLLLLAEEDAEEAWRRIYPLAHGLALSDAEKDEITSRLVVLPFAGRIFRLANERGDETPELRALRDRILLEAGPTGWSLIAFDPFARMAAPEAEVDQTMATRTVQAAETLVASPGGPTVLIAHHASMDGIKSKSIRARGVTALFDAVRWEATLRVEGSDVWFRQSKSNYSAPMPDELRLIRGPGGLLRAATPAEEEERAARGAAAKDAKDAEKDAKREERIAALERALLDALANAALPPTSQAELTALVPGRREERQDAVARLLASGRITRPARRGDPYLVAHGCVELEPRG